MNKLLLVVPLVLCGCVESNQPQTELKNDNSEIGIYKECMGYSDKTQVFTKDTSERYIVLMSDASSDQHFINKKEQGQIYYTSLLKCDTGKDISDCKNQDRLIIKNIGTKEKWKVGTIKNFNNADFVYDKEVSFQFLSDGRPFSTTDYCYRDRNNLNKSYCGKHVFSTNNDVCKDKKPK